MATGEIPESAPHGESGDAGGRYETEHGGQPMELRLPIDVGQCAACLRARRAAGRVHPHPSQQRQVDHEPTLADRKAGDVVAAAANGYEQPML